MFPRILENFASFRRIPLKVVLITALASYVLQIGAIIQGQPLYIIVLFTLVPWVPVLFFEVLWKYEHYGWMAVFVIVAMLQIGHLGEHITQVVQLQLLPGTLACPPPVDTGANVERAVRAGLRSPTEGATGLSSQWVNLPNEQGLPALDANGNPIRGPAACGILGQLDLELVHLVWELLGWFATLWLVAKYSRNLWLWIAVAFLSVHAVEHLFISWLFFFDKNFVFEVTRQLWATTAEGNIVTAHPVGQEVVLANFYEAGGKNGIFGAGGLVSTLLGVEGLPGRAVLHLGYNTLITVPTVIGFVVQVRHVYDIYLAKALPGLSEEQLVQTTPKLENVRVPAGGIVIRQGDMADRFYIVVRGELEVVLERPEGEQVIDRRVPGEFFGEIGLMQNSRRTATVRALSDVELIALDRGTFSELMDGAETSRSVVDQLMRSRLTRIDEATTPV
jgi:hypothetical protein